jgi:HEAT repeat protein
MTKNKHIFLSYRSAEADFALRLAADLKNAGVNLWMDRLDIKPGDDWIQALQSAVNECAGIISILSPEYVASNYCRGELARAVRMGRQIFPVLLRPVPAPDWPFEVERLQYIDFSNWQDEQVYKAKLNDLVQSLKNRLADQVNPIPDAETRYLTSLIADLEARKGVLEYVELAAMTDAPTGEDSIRPRPRIEETWGVSGTFRVLEGAVESESLADDALNRPSQHKATPLDGILQAVERYPRFVLVGSPGAGKTTTIQRLTLDTARARQLNARSHPIPLLLYLPAWGDSTSLVEFVRSQWPFTTDVIALLAEGKVLLYLDGLNEMGATGPHKAKMLRRWLHGANAPKRVIVTCRLSDYTEELNLDLPSVIAEEMDETRIRRFVTNYLGKEEASSLLERVIPENDEDLEDSRHLYQIARNPFLLTVLILVYMSSQERDLPRNMGALMERLVMELWEREGVRQTPGWTPFEQMQTAFSALACAMIDEDMPIHVSREYALVHVRDEGLLRAGISANLLGVQGENVFFYHQLIQEYLAAVGVSQVGIPPKLMRPRFDKRGSRLARKWDQVIIALSGIVIKPDWIVREVSEVDPYLALDCVASGIPVDESTRQQAIEGLKNYVSDDGSDGRIAAGRLLASLGDSSAIDVLMDAMRTATWDIRQTAARSLREIRVPPLPGLLEALRDWEQDLREATATAVRHIGSGAVPVLLNVLYDEHWSVRRGAAWALGEIGDAAAVPGLVEALRDEESLVRREAAFALGWIRDKDSVAGLLEALQDKDWRVRKAAAETLGWIGAPSVAGLSQALHDTSINVRRVAAEALGRIGHASAVPTLLDALRDDSPDVRGAAVEALGWIKDPDSASAIIQCLQDPTQLKVDDRRVCDIAAQALEFMDTLEAVTALHEWQQKNNIVSAPSSMMVRNEDNETMLRWIDALRDEDALKRWSAVKALASFSDPSAINGILRCLSDEDILVCDAAAEALAQIGSPAVPGLLEALKDSNPNVRGGAAEALGKIKDASAVSPLMDCLKDTAKPWLSEERICDIAVKALESIGTKQALNAAKEWRKVHTPLHVTGTPEAMGSFYDATLPELLTSLHNPNWDIRQEAATALKEQSKTLRGTSHPQVQQMLAAALDDNDWFVRWAVAESLAWIGDASAVSPLLKILNDPNWMVRVATIRALLEIGDTRAVSGLVNALHDEHHLVREVTAEALGKMANATAVPGLLEALRDLQPFVRRAAVEALGHIGQKTAVSAMIPLLRDEDNQVRWSATEALGRLGDPAAVPELIARFNDDYAPSWEEKRVCDVAAAALEKIGTQEAKSAVERWKQQQMVKQ